MRSLLCVVSVGAVAGCELPSELSPSTTGTGTTAADTTTSTAADTTTSTAADTTTSTVVDTTVARSDPPLALVYRGPGGCPSCSEAVADLLRSTEWGFEIRYVGPDGDLELTSENLEEAVLYVQPGGDGSLSQAYAALESDAAEIRRFVESGGRYLGICMGGYLAGSGPGFGLLPGDSGQYISSDGASVTETASTVVQVDWQGESRFMFFQDGGFFTLDGDRSGSTVLAHYTNGEIAAMVSPYGSGRVAVSGPHPEATDDWYRYNGITDPDGPDADLGRELIDAVMQP